MGGLHLKRLPAAAAAPPQVASFLADETETGSWAVEGLPSDDLSIQAGAEKGML